MTPVTERIDYDKLTALVKTRPGYPSQAALYAALTGINAAERAMRDKTAALRSALDDTDARLNAGPGHRADSRLIVNAAADLDRASTARDIHWATAAALLTEDDLHQLTATPASGK